MSNDFEHGVYRRIGRLEHLIERVLHLLEKPQEPQLKAFQTGDPMSIGSIAPGTTGQFAGVLNFPAGQSAPAGYNPQLTWSSSDPSITFAPATTDATNGAIPLDNQVVASVPVGDTLTDAQVAFTALGTDGVTVLTSNPVSFQIPQTTPPPTEPTLVASQVA